MKHKKMLMYLIIITLSMIALFVASSKKSFVVEPVIHTDPVVPNISDILNYTKVKLKIGYVEEFGNGTIVRPIYGCEVDNPLTGENEQGRITSAWNVTVTVYFPYENATYKGFIEESYFVAGYIGRNSYCYWDVTNIQGMYTQAEAYGWKRVS